MTLGDPPRDRQSESGAALGFARRVETHESLEDALAIDARDAASGV